MTVSGHILIVDDDAEFVVIYRELLEDLGLQVTVASSADDATRSLERSGADLDVVLLDQKLQGPGGPDSGLDLVGRIQGLAPFAKTIVVTGYATTSAIERAFQAGVYDYLVKNGAFEALLRAKVRNAVEITRERRLAGLTLRDAAAKLKATWAQVKTETDKNRKGALLEELVKVLFHATPGFERVQTRLSNESEEIDIVVENRSDDPLWKQDGGVYVLGECKNWSSPCGPAEFLVFHGKFATKAGRARIGFFFATGGFTSGFHDERAKRMTDNVLIIPVDAEDLEKWIASEDRVAVLNDLHKRATFDKSR